MDQHIAFFAAVVMVVGIIAFIIIQSFNYRLKKRIIDSGPVDEDAVKFVSKLSNPNSEQLKWGCIIFAAGLGLVVNHFIPMEENSGLGYGIEAMFVAAGFLAYYFIMQRKQD